MLKSEEGEEGGGSLSKAKNDLTLIKYPDAGQSLWSSESNLGSTKGDSEFLPNFQSMVSTPPRGTSGLYNRIYLP